MRIELGPRDVARDHCVMVRRDLRKKELVPLADAAATAGRMLDQMQHDLFAKAKAFRDSHTFEVQSYDELKKRADDGFMLAHWCVDPKCEKKIKDDTGVTSRNRPFDLEQAPGKCIVCGTESPGSMVWAKAY